MLKLAWIGASHLTRAIARSPREAALALGGAVSGHPRQPRRLACALAIVLPLALLGRSLVPQMRIVMSPSIEAWAVRPDPGPIASGDYVMFTLSHPLAGPTPVNVTKHALCLPGARLTMIERPSLSAHGQRDGYYYCGGRLLGISKPFGRGGQRLAHFRWPGGPIPPGMAYVGSANPDSFDSRYFGLVRLDRLTRMRRVL
jgi:conjugal transfer pilin signal peptidase TrbI